MISIYGVTLQKLEDYFISIGEKKFKAIQVYEWLYKKRVKDFDEMKNVKKETIEQLKKDVKYYTGQNFSIAENDIKILDIYREFLKVNEGFVKTQNTTDIKLPSSLKAVDENTLNAIATEIEKVIDNGKLYNLISLAEKVL